jgi:hypothetical protein
VEDSVEGLALLAGGDEKVFKSRPVGQLPFDKFHPFRQKIAPAMAQVVKDNSSMSQFDKQAGHCTTYVPRAACDQYLHK